MATPDFFTRGSNARRRLVGTAGVATLAATLIAQPSAVATLAASSSAIPGPSAPLPHLPSVPTTITDRQSVQSLFNQAIAPLSLGEQARTDEAAVRATQPPLTHVTVPLPSKNDTSSSQVQTSSSQVQTSSSRVQTSPQRSEVRTALVRTQAELVSAQVSLHQAQIDASAAGARAAASLRRVRQDQAAYKRLDGEVRKTALLLYMWGGPEALAPNPKAGEAAVYANAYAESAVPIKAIATRQHDATVLAQALSAARTAQRDADHDLAQARIAFQTAQAVQQKLQHELSSLLPNRPAVVATPATTVAAQAADVAAQAAEVAAQAGRELTSPSALEFTPSSSLSGPVSTTVVALAWAFEELGKPYVWGGTGPNSFDCSGLTQYVWAKAGVQIPRVAVDQYTWATPVPLSQLLPGDLVFFGQTDIHHVGIYIGDGLMINAPHTGDVVRVSSIWWSDLAGFGRVHAAGVPGPLRAPPSAQQPAPEAVVPAAGPVPSQTSPPPGWQPTPGSSAPLPVTPSTATTTTTTTTTTSTPSTTGSTTTTAPTTTTTTPGRSPATMMTLPPTSTAP